MNGSTIFSAGIKWSRNSRYSGKIGSSDFDDPFTQEEKIGKVSKGKEPETGKERFPFQEIERQRDYSEELEGYGERYIDKYQDFPTFYG